MKEVAVLAKLRVSKQALKEESHCPIWITSDDPARRTLQFVPSTFDDNTIALNALNPVHHPTVHSPARETVAVNLTEQNICLRCTVLKVLNNKYIQKSAILI